MTDGNGARRSVTSLVGWKRLFEGRRAITFLKTERKM